MPNIDILEKKEWNTKQVVTIVVIAVSLTFSAAMIWSRFTSSESNHTTLSDRVEKKDARAHERIDKLEERIDELETEHN
jgi:hypothetical protein